MVFKLGELVYSNAGRDVGRKFIILKILDEEYVLISDGSLRKMIKPKKKKVKHIRSCGIVIDTLKEKLENKVKITDAEIRKSIALYEKNIEVYK